MKFNLPEEVPFAPQNSCSLNSSCTNTSVLLFLSYSCLLSIASYLRRMRMQILLIGDAFRVPVLPVNIKRKTYMRAVFKSSTCWLACEPWQYSGLCIQNGACFMFVHLGAKVVSETEVGEEFCSLCCSPHVMCPGMQLPLLVGKAPFF